VPSRAPADHLAGERPKAGGGRRGQTRDFRGQDLLEFVRDVDLLEEFVDEHRADAAWIFGSASSRVLVVVQLSVFSTCRLAPHREYGEHADDRGHDQYPGHEPR